MMSTRFLNSLAALILSTSAAAASELVQTHLAGLKDVDLLVFVPHDISPRSNELQKTLQSEVGARLHEAGIATAGGGPALLSISLIALSSAELGCPDRVAVLVRIEEFEDVTLKRSPSVSVAGGGQAATWAQHFLFACGKDEVEEKSRQWVLFWVEDFVDAVKLADKEASEPRR
jgi:hypothetical protein